MKKLLPLFLILPFLASCIGAKVHTSFNNDGSGTMVMEFTISQMFFQMGEAAEGSDTGGIPFTADDLTEDFRDRPGVTVREVTEESSEEAKTIRAVIDFENFEALGGSDTMEGASLTRKGKGWMYRMELAEGKSSEELADQEEVDESTRQMMENLFAGYEISFSVTAPKKIKSHSLGELSDDGLTVTYAMDTLTFSEMKNPDPLILNVIW